MGHATMFFKEKEGMLNFQEKYCFSTISVNKSVEK